MCQGHHGEEVDLHHASEEGRESEVDEPSDCDSSAVHHCENVSVGEGSDALCGLLDLLLLREVALDGQGAELLGVQRSLRCVAYGDDDGSLLEHALHEQQSYHGVCSGDEHDPSLHVEPGGGEEEAHAR